MIVLSYDKTNEKLTRLFELGDYDYMTFRLLTEFIDDTAFEVITCKDCKKYMPKTHACANGSLMYPDENDFCSRGER